VLTAKGIEPLEKVSFYSRLFFCLFFKTLVFPDVHAYMQLASGDLNIDWKFMSAFKQACMQESTQFDMNAIKAVAMICCIFLVNSWHKM